MKLKNEIADRLFALSPRELDLFLYMARVQDEETGVAHGIHFREAMRRTGMCRQSFYNAMRGLARKGFIRERRSGSADYDVEIVGNAFPGKDYSCGYVNLNRKIFRDGRFRRLKAAEKCLFLHLARLIPGGRTRRMPAAALIEGLRGLASVCRRTLLGYLRSLRRMVQIRIKGGTARRRCSRWRRGRGARASSSMRTSWAWRAGGAASSRMKARRGTLRS